MFKDEGPLFQDQDEELSLVTAPDYDELEHEGVGEPISLDYLPAYQTYPATGEEQVAYILVLLHTTGQSQHSQNNPLNLCLVLDQSSSMRGEKLFAIKSAARQVVDQLSSEDYFSLISFNDRATNVVNCQRVTSRESIKQMIDSIEGKGGTELANGLYAGIAEMRPATQFTNLNYILLLTDGQTYGDTDRCVQLGQEAARYKIVIHPMGVGTDWNEDLLETVAAKSGGSSEYIESADKIVSIFMQKIQQLRGTMTQTSSLRFEPTGGVKLKLAHRLSPVIAELGLVNTPDGAVEANLGPLGQDYEYSILLEIVIPPQKPGISRIGNLSLTFGEAGASGAVKKVELPLGLNFAITTKGVGIDPEVKTMIEKVITYKLQARAWQDIADGDIESGSRRLGAVSTRLLSMGMVDLAQQVQQEVRNLEQRGTASSQGKKRIKYGTRGLTADFIE